MWHTDDIRVHTSDIRMAYDYTDDWHTNRSDIRHIEVTYKWHMSDIRVHTIDIWMKYKFHVNDLRMT